MIATITCMDDLEQQYKALVERVRGYSMPESARARILAEIEATYRRETARAAPLNVPPGTHGKSIG